ncbi:MAG: hypothetical protein ACYT04_97640, partial [Nostoc sp.]
MRAIAYSTQKVMIFSSDSSSLMLFFPLRIRAMPKAASYASLTFPLRIRGDAIAHQITLAATLPNAVSKRVV